MNNDSKNNNDLIFHSFRMAASYNCIITHIWVGCLALVFIYFQATSYTLKYVIDFVSLFSFCLSVVFSSNKDTERRNIRKNQIEFNSIWLIFHDFMRKYIILKFYKIDFLQISAKIFLKNKFNYSRYNTLTIYSYITYIDG